MPHSHAAERRAPPRNPGAEAGIDEALVRRVVTDFYARVRRDPLLGPIFEQAVEDWPAHLDRLTDFWSSLTLMSGRYKGNPFEAHLELPKLEPEHFRTWLGLFDSTVNDLCTKEQAEIFCTRARRVADSLSMGLAIRRGAPPPPRR
ncbi:MAG TPA: group III truncated hemoglobin [Acetobacteraceae bacterium]|nr:group III truncated hemoglobin [Acetobacteraceae bacterium]